ncbi:MAG: 2-isopropylmalate synthase, partial [Deltaproteobacteria bacterium]|nr:2-isopropylmalate synthase [Deltaproteobacteria bacterium]
FKELADKKKTITDADLEALVADQIAQPEAVYKLEGLQVACGTMGLPTATVKLTGPEGKEHVKAGVGTGPVDAAFRAIDELVHVDSTLLEFSVQSVTRGIDALGEVSVRIAKNDQPKSKAHPQYERSAPRTYLGHGADTDIVVASAKAYLMALNKLLVANRSTDRPQDDDRPVAQA